MTTTTHSHKRWTDKGVTSPQLVHRDLIVNTDERLVHRGGDGVKLTVKEYELLLFLLRHKQQVLSRHQILIGVWGDTWCGDDNLLEVYIRYLRKYRATRS